MFAILAMREPIRVGITHQNPRVRDAWLELWHYRARITPLLGGMVMAELAFGAAYVWAAPALSRTFNLPPDRIGAIMGSG